MGRADDWNKQAETIITLVERYEAEHPDDAMCLSNYTFDIDGFPFELIEVERTRGRHRGRRRG